MRVRMNRDDANYAELKGRRGIKGLCFLVSLMSLMSLSLSILLLTTSTALAQDTNVAIQKIEITPQKLFVGDTAECKLVLYNPNSEAVKVSSIYFSVLEGSVSVKPNFLKVGSIQAKSTHELKFYIEAKDPGLNLIEVRVNAGGDTIIQTFAVYVEKNLPALSFDRKIRLGEVNRVNLTLISPIEIQNVVIEPLFDAEPKKIFAERIQSGSFPIRFYGGTEENESYSFRISFYDGDNFHSYVQSIKPDFVNSKGVLVNLSMPASIYLYDAVPMTLELSNLRTDTIYNVTISANSSTGKFGEGEKSITFLEPEKSKAIQFLFTGLKSGEEEISFKITFEDEMGNVHTILEKKGISVLNQPAISVTGVEISVQKSASTQSGGFLRPSKPETRATKVTVSGDVSNNGKSKVYNVYVYVDMGGNRKDYFIGTIDPSDFQSFSIPATGNERSVKVTVSWANEIGEQFEITKKFSLTPSERVREENWNFLLLLIPAAVLVAILVLWRKTRRTKGARGNRETQKARDKK